MNWNLKPESDIQFGNMRFLVIVRPADLPINQYIEGLKGNNVRAVVRICEPSYAAIPLEDEGITVMDLELRDDPSKEILNKWIKLVNDTFKTPGSAIAVHCAKGLDWSYSLVVVALMEAGVKDKKNAMELIKDDSQFTQKQLIFLDKYKPCGKLKKFQPGNKKCMLM